MASITIQTLGCRLNQIESEGIGKFFGDAGFDVGFEPLTAAWALCDEIFVCVVNTCSVTQKSEQKARRLIRMALEKCPRACVIVTGCYAELGQKELLALDQRIAVLPGQKKSRLEKIPKILRQIVAVDDTTGANGTSFCAEIFAQKIQREIFDPEQDLPNVAEATFRLRTDNFAAHSRASIKIQDGCNSSCAYCAIKNARGKAISLEAQSVVEQIVSLEKSGQQEVVFTGVNVAQYASEFEGRRVGFAGLLELILERTEKISLRLSSIWPTIVTDNFCRVISSARVQPHFHLSVQSGSNKILTAMRRGYTAQDVAAAVQKLRSAKKNPFIACDIIAGFPGESEGDFAATVELLEQSNFAWIHAFPFSARPGTEAFALPNKIPQRVAGERVAQIIELAKKNKIAYINSCSSQKFFAIAENTRQDKAYALKAGSTAKRVAQELHAVTENFLHCKINVAGRNNIPAPGQKITVEILGADEAAVAQNEEYDVSAQLV